MEEIKHKFIEVNGLKLHVAEIGSESSPAVVFLHGFPEIWYSWRYQMIAMAKAGFRAIAFDYRGYGLSEQPTEPEKTTFLDFDNDLLELLDALNIPKEPGRAEADFGRFDAKTVVRKIYILFSRSEIPIADENQEILDLVEPGTPLPYWFSEKDLAIYGAKYEKSGFRTALQVPYRAMAEQLNVTARTVQVPAMLIMGEKDYVLKFPGMEDYIRGEELKSLVPKLEIVFMRKGTHFVQEQMPNEVNQLLLSFLLQNKST
ncbi:epoxide hydrolase 2-like isoform X2 [Nicotiana sylvestris]|uniref:Bifunctional epoxide hydrolase 2-like isoform X2 n=1 Tax=Nicotiana sylvestris TaxID=4096 RepID=A0A1U7X0G4_NICSY|nr:PREDICTED: bifunctional epoxide hydrolase 2-like isoform X2 [Nicotiana sylvestris]